MSEHKCQQQVWNNYRYYPCDRKAKVEHEDKFYCGIHDPVKRAEKNAVRDAAREVRYEADRKRYAMQSAAPALCEALQACRDYLDAIPESAAGGDDEAISLVRKADAVLAKARGES
jgi:hypothetical protein